MTAKPAPIPMNTIIKRFSRNTAGRDLVIGDIHGCFTKALAALDAVGFDPAAGDRLFSVGDLVDRGPESEHVLWWLDQPWFAAVQGNHEDMAIRWGRPGCPMDAELYALNGGAWNIANTAPERLKYSDALQALPLAIEVETAAGLVGIVHADCPFGSWWQFTAALENPALTADQREAVKEATLWSRDRVKTKDISGVYGVVAVVVGHTPQETPRWLGNVLYLDTAAWYRNGAPGREFAIFDLETMQPAVRAAILGKGQA